LKRIVLLACVLILAIGLVPVQQVQALAYGQADDTRHEYVAFVTDLQQDCAATALSPLVLVTSGDCYQEDGHPVWVNFQSVSDPIQKSAWVPGEWIVPDGTCLTCDQQYGTGIAVSILDAPVELHAYAQVSSAEPGLGMTGEVVGYQVVNGVVTQSLDTRAFVRQFALAAVIPNKPMQPADTFQIQSSFQEAGVCFNATGGPVLVEKSSEVVGVIATGDPGSCRKKAIATGLSSPAVQDFLRMALEDPVGLKTRHD
jgi:hypothetical protein